MSGELSKNANLSDTQPDVHLVLMTISNLKSFPINNQTAFLIQFFLFQSQVKKDEYIWNIAIISGTGRTQKMTKAMKQKNVITILILWWFNEIFVTFILVALPFLFLARPKIKHLLWVIAGFLLIIFLELLIVKISTGSLFTRFTCILKTEAAVVSNKNPEYLPRTLFKVWNINPFNEEWHFGILWHLFVIVTILALFLKEKLPLALALGCWLWLGYLQWGIQSLDGTPIARYICYISMIVPLQCLAFGAILGHFAKFSKRLNIVITFLFVLLLIHLSWLGTKAVNTTKIRTEDFKEITRFLSSLELKSDDIIYTDGLTANFVEIYTKGNLIIQRANNFQIPNLPEKGFLVADGSKYIFQQPEYRRALPQWFLDPPPAHWPLLYTVRGKNIGIYKDFDPKIYRILPQ